MRAFLREESAFFGLFEGGAVPVKAPVSTRANLEYEPERTRAEEVYFVDLEAITPEQFEGIVQVFRERSGIPVNEIRLEIRAIGLPLRASQVKAVSFDARRIL